MVVGAFIAVGNDLKDIFASARNGDENRCLKIVTEDGSE